MALLSFSMQGEQNCGKHTASNEKLQAVLSDWKGELENRLQCQFAQFHQSVVSMLTEHIHSLEAKLETEMTTSVWEGPCFSDIEQKPPRIRQFEMEGSFGAPPRLHPSQNGHHVVSLADEIAAAENATIHASSRLLGNHGTPEGVTRATSSHVDPEIATNAPTSALACCWPFAAPAATQSSRTPVFSRIAVAAGSQESEGQSPAQSLGRFSLFPQGHNQRFSLAAFAQPPRFSALLDADPTPQQEDVLLFDTMDIKELKTVAVDSSDNHYNLFDNQVATMLARRSLCPVWGVILRFKASGDVPGAFKQLDALNCFTIGQEWRGDLGETVFHICFLLMGDTPDGMQTNFGKLAVMIYDRNPNFINMPYLPGFYAGEVPLHLAIAHTDMGSLKWLLERGAEIEHLATGEFFRQFRWGEHPVAWAACAHKLEILEELLKAKADCRFKDSNQNTVLHNMATAPVLWSGPKFVSVVQTLKKFDPKIGEDFSAFNVDTRTPLQLASAYPTGNVHSLLRAMGDISWVFGGVQCNKHPLHGWDSATTLHASDQHQDELSALEVAVVEHNSEFFCVPLNQLLLQAKWKFFVRRRVVRRAIYFSTFSIISTAAFCVRDRFGMILAICLHAFSFVLGLALLISNVITALRCTKTKFFRSCKDWATKAILLDLHKSLACIGVLAAMGLDLWLESKNTHSKYYSLVETAQKGMLKPMTMLAIWSCTTELLLVHEYTCMVLIIGKEVFAVELPVYFFFQLLMLAAFSAAIYASTQKTYDDEHTRPSEFISWIETLTSLAFVPLGAGGDLDLQGIFSSENNFIQVFLYFGYSSLSCILFLNLTISLFTERTMTIWSNKHQYYYHLLAFQCIAEEKRRDPKDLQRLRVGSKFSDGKRYLLVQKFPRQDRPAVKLKSSVM